MVCNLTKVVTLFELIANISLNNIGSILYMNRIVDSLQNDIHYVKFSTMSKSFPNLDFKVPVVLERSSYSSSFLHIIVINQYKDLMFVFFNISQLKNFHNKILEPITLFIPNTMQQSFKDT